MNRLALLCLFSFLTCRLLLARAEDKEEIKIYEETKSVVLKMAEDLKKGDQKAATKKAQALVAKLKDPDDVSYLEMLTSRPRPKRKITGLGVLDKPPANYRSYGIEIELFRLSRRTPDKKLINAHAADLERMAYRVAAISEIQALMPPKRFRGKKHTKENWLKWSTQAQKDSLELAKAFRAKDVKLIRTTAKKVVSSCNNCHNAFRI